MQKKNISDWSAYGKTDELAPGESQVLTLTYDTDEMAYYSEEKASYILDPGTYYVRVGDSSRNTKVAGDQTESECSDRSSVQSDGSSGKRKSDRVEQGRKNTIYLCDRAKRKWQKPRYLHWMHPK